MVFSCALSILLETTSKDMASYKNEASALHKKFKAPRLEAICPQDQDLLQDRRGESSRLLARTGAAAVNQTIAVMMRVQMDTRKVHSTPETMSLLALGHLQSYHFWWAIVINVLL